MRRMSVIASVFLVGAVGNVDAKWRPHAAAVPVVRAGAFTGLPWLGAPIPPTPSRATPSPVVGSVERTGHFVHPHTGRTRYAGTTYDPALGRFGTFRFRK